MWARIASGSTKPQDSKQAGQKTAAASKNSTPKSLEPARPNDHNNTSVASAVGSVPREVNTQRAPQGVWGQKRQSGSPQLSSAQAQPVQSIREQQSMQTEEKPVVQLARVLTDETKEAAPTMISSDQAPSWSSAVRSDPDDGSLTARKSGGAAEADLQASVASYAANAAAMLTASGNETMAQRLKAVADATAAGKSPTLPPAAAGVWGKSPTLRPAASLKSDSGSEPQDNPLAADEATASDKRKSPSLQPATSVWGKPPTAPKNTTLNGKGEPRHRSNGKAADPEPEPAVDLAPKPDPGGGVWGKKSPNLGPATEKGKSPVLNPQARVYVSPSLQPAEPKQDPGADEKGKLSLLNRDPKTAVWGKSPKLGATAPNVGKSPTLNPNPKTGAWAQVSPSLRGKKSPSLTPAGGASGELLKSPAWRVDAPVFVPGQSPLLTSTTSTPTSAALKTSQQCPFIPGTSSTSPLMTGEGFVTNLDDQGQAAQLAALLPPSAGLAPLSHTAEVGKNPKNPQKASKPPQLPKAPPKPPQPPKSWADLASRNVPDSEPSTAGGEEGASRAAPGQESVPASEGGSKVVWASCREPRGLVNRQNECFLNATMQALVACHPLSLAMGNATCSAKKGRLLPAVQEFLKEYNTAPPAFQRNPALLPESMLALLPAWKPQQQRGSQEDAQEFLAWLLDGLHEETAISQGGTTEQPGSADDEWLEVGKKNKSATVSSTVKLDTSQISQVVGGAFRSIVKRRGKGESVSRQPFFGIPLDIGEQRVQSVDDAMEQFVSREAVDEADMHKCVALEEMPQVLILQMKRFVYKGSSIEKVGKCIQFSEKLSFDKRHLAASTLRQEGSRGMQYKLIAVIVHHGKKAQSGHYTCYVHVSPEAQPDGSQAAGWWAHCDDEKVTRVEVQEVLKQQAYVLLYQKVES